MSGDDTPPNPIANLAREVSLLSWRVNHLEQQIARVHRIAWILLASIAAKAGFDVTGFMKP